MGKADMDVIDQQLFRETIERNVRDRCHGNCRQCSREFGGANGTYRTWEDLASWIFGYCSNECRLAAGEPQQFDIYEALKVLYPGAN